MKYAGHRFTAECRLAGKRRTRLARWLHLIVQPRAKLGIGSVVQRA
ncbi:MAG: hypothetical protein ACJAYX_004746 [Planctomycetota bacterium]|jgi:hypothetical protein